jgi:excisionase family DNA binding protein
MALTINIRTQLKLEEAAQRWGMSVATLRDLIKRKSIQSIKIGRRRYISMSEVLRIEKEGTK